MAIDKGPNVADVRDGDQVVGLFLVARKGRATGKSGKPYLTVGLQDRTGTLDGRVWDNADALDAQFSEGQVVRVVGRATSYRGMLQLSVTEVTAVAADDFDPGAFLPVSAYAPEAMEAALRETVASLPDPDVRALLSLVLDDPDVGPRLRRCPAATVHHHAFVGGLLEHTLSVVRLVEALAAHYERLYPGLVDRSLLVAGALLHDIGKTAELDVAAGFRYTDAGRLVGHLVQGVQIVDRAARALPDFPPGLLARIQHLVLSHHGQLEYGSPKRPHTAEAMLLHNADMIDSRMYMFAAACREAGSERWSRYQGALDAYVLNPYEDRAPAPSDPAWWDGPLADAAADPASSESASPDDVPPPADAPPARARRARGVRDPAGRPQDDDGPHNLDLF